MGLALPSLSGIEKAAPEAASLSSFYHTFPSVKPRAGPHKKSGPPGGGPPVKSR